MDAQPHRRQRRPTADPVPVGVRPGSVVGGRYLIRKLHARGAMSRVFEAEQLGIGRRVALKVIHRTFVLQSDAVARFEQEARALARIDHPNIVTVYDIGKTDQDEPFIAMEFVAGPTLDDLVRENQRLSPARAVGVLLQIARALASVHEVGVVHRDLKPSNVLIVTRRSSAEVAKIGDFGLAKVVRDRTGDHGFATRDGMVVGTPEYMAPEQIKGGHIDARADIYALGCLAYHMLTGAPPFVGDEMATLYKHLHEKPPLLRDACPGARIPAPFQALIDGALAKDPKQRFGSAVEFCAALLRASEEAGIPHQELRLIDSLVDGITSPSSRDARPSSVAARPSPRLAIVWGALLMVALLSGAMFGKHYFQRDAPPPAPELLTINSKPPGAVVELDGVALPETTPTSVRGVAPGAHTVRLHKEGYSAVERAVELGEGDRRALDVRLPPDSRTVLVRTVPSGALVFLDGKLVSSSTPATLTVLSDEFHEIRLEKLGYEPRKVRITPDDHEPELELTLDTESRDIGSLWIDANGAAEVWIDDMYTGYTTPTFGLRVPVGHHTIELRDSSGTRSDPIALDIQRGESLHLTMSMETCR